MKFSQIEHIDCYTGETIYWADITDLPQKLQDKAREVDGENYCPTCFGLAVYHNIPEQQWDVIVDSQGDEGHDANIFYIDRNGEKHWFYVALPDDFLKQVYSVCQKIQEGKEVEGNGKVIDTIQFDNGYGFALIEYAGKKEPYQIKTFTTDHYGQREYSHVSSYSYADLADIKKDLLREAENYQRIHHVKPLKPSLAAQLKEAKKQAAQEAGQHESTKSLDKDER